MFSLRSFSLRENIIIIIIITIIKGHGVGQAYALAYFGKLDALQKITLLGTAHILKRVLSS